MSSQQPDKKKTELDLLQTLLVEPEVKKLRQQVSELQESVKTLEQQVKRLETSQQNTGSAVHDLLNQKLNALRQEMLDTLPGIVDEAISEQIEPGQTFSIRVVGIDQDD